MSTATTSDIVKWAQARLAAGTLTADELAQAITEAFDRGNHFGFSGGFDVLQTWGRQGRSAASKKAVGKRHAKLDPLRAQVAKMARTNPKLSAEQVAEKFRTLHQDVTQTHRTVADWVRSARRVRSRP